MSNYLVTSIDTKMFSNNYKDYIIHVSEISDYPKTNIIRIKKGDTLPIIKNNDVIYLVKIGLKVSIDENNVATIHSSRKKVTKIHLLKLNENNIMTGLILL